MYKLNKFVLNFLHIQYNKIIYSVEGPNGINLVSKYLKKVPKYKNF